MKQTAKGKKKAAEAAATAAALTQNIKFAMVTGQTPASGSFAVVDGSNVAVVAVPSSGGLTSPAAGAVIKMETEPAHTQARQGLLQYVNYKRMREANEGEISKFTIKNPTLDQLTPFVEGSATNGKKFFVLLAFINSVGDAKLTSSGADVRTIELYYYDDKGKLARRNLTVWDKHVRFPFGDSLKKVMVFDGVFAKLVMGVPGFMLSGNGRIFASPATEQAAKLEFDAEKLASEVDDF